MSTVRTGPRASDWGPRSTWARPQGLHRSNREDGGKRESNTEGETAVEGNTAVSNGATTTNNKLLDWVDEVATLCQPDRIHWCDGSAEGYDRFAQALVHARTLTRLRAAKRPNSYWPRSDPADVARVEDRTFICSQNKDD